MTRAPVDPRVEYDATGGWRAVRGVHETNAPRTLALDVEKDAAGGYRLQVRTTDDDLQRRLGEDLTRSHPLELDRAQLWAAVQACRHAWRTKVVDHLEGGRYPFQDAWDMTPRPGLRDRVLRPVAEAGADLFYRVFFPRPPDPRPYESLRRVGRVLRDEMAVPGRHLWLRVTSDSFYVPWSLIYSEDPMAPIRPEGFWGYQHLIEHSPDGSGNLGYELEPGDPPARPLAVGLQLDERIDATLGVACLAPVEDLLAGYDAGHLKTERRVLKKQLRQALSSAPPTDQVLYFCCHARQEGDLSNLRLDRSHLTLSDPADGEITPSDIGRWIGMESFERHPVVFLNACEGGQINSIFYQGFGNTFLGLGAASVVGPQTEVPAVFAGELARRFFERFFEGGERRSLGRVLFDLRREMLDQHDNPLGLVYSLYRGADTFLRAPLQRR